MPPGSPAGRRRPGKPRASRPSRAFPRFSARRSIRRNRRLLQKMRPHVKRRFQGLRYLKATTPSISRGAAVGAGCPVTSGCQTMAETGGVRIGESGDSERRKAGSCESQPNKGGRAGHWKKTLKARRWRRSDGYRLFARIPEGAGIASHLPPFGQCDRTAVHHPNRFPSDPLEHNYRVTRLSE